jgi:hypothetical protein
VVIEEVQAGRRTPEGRTPFRPDTPRLVLATLVLAELGADVRQQHGEAERLGDVVDTSSTCHLIPLLRSSG